MFDIAELKSMREYAYPREYRAFRLVRLPVQRLLGRHLDANKMIMAMFVFALEVFSTLIVMKGI